jgi:purine-nucleoside phosphorylase
MEKVLTASILDNKDYPAKSVFLPENLLREARRQKNISECEVPSICLLDPDGDLLTYLLEKGLAKKNNCWACYHSHLYTFEISGVEVGIIPCIVGSSYAVLVAEQLFVSGCKYLISVTSSGIINPPNNNKRFALITEAIRDEGTSYHYLPKEIPSILSEVLRGKLNGKEYPWFDAKSWTTDAPYRETETAINAMKAENVTCVEMEAAALYAFAEAKNQHVICFAHLTNTMAQEHGDFEKGEYFGSIDTLNLLKEVIKCL